MSVINLLLRIKTIKTAETVKKNSNSVNYK